MTQDQHNPTPQSSESIDGSSSSDAPAKTAKSTGSARAPRRRHTPSRSRQPKEQANDQKDTKATTETQSQQDQQYQQAEQPSQQRPVAVAAPAAVENAPQVGAETGAETTAETATEPTQPAKSGQRASARGRRGGGSRRRGNKAEDVQLVPVVSAEQTATSTSPTLSGELAGAATETQESPADDLPAPEPLPLDTAILAHLDALAQAAGATGQQEAASGEATSAPQDETPAQTRRYRFDRPRAQATTSATPPRTERLSGWRATPPTLMTTAPQAPTEAEAETVAVREAPASETEAITGESAPTESAERVEANAPVIAGGSPEATEGSESSEGSEAPEVFEAGEAPADEEEAAGTEAASEDDEHAEHEGAGRRRRRRGRRSVRGQDAETGEIEGDEHHEQQGHAEPSPTAPTAPSSPSGRSRSRAPYAAPETVVTYGHDYDSGNNGNVLATEGFDEPGYSPYTPTPAPRTRASRSGQPAARHQAESEWSMSTAQEHMQEPASPFGAPEPSFARGFGPQSSGVAAPLHEPLPRIRRGERGGEAPPMSANQLGAVLTNSFAQQTDRLLNELRRQQYPPSMTVALPAFPSTERIGVFVDVANLLYSARNQRMSIDFGRLLDFLRGNRRLIRAHAYAPTNPDPHAEQTFLAAVKGVGYRITTKNYKTFASGARKADMDLDLCMDIVRLVDAGALDTVALVSGDSDFLPLLEYCSDHGVRVEVAAFDDAAAMILRQSCDLFINLSQVDEIRA